MRKAVCFFFLFLLFSTLLIVDCVNSNNTAGTRIYIRPNGSIEPSTVSIERNGNVYTFTDNVQASLFVEKDGVVIDGAGFKLQGTGANDYRANLPERKYDTRTTPESNNTGIYSYSQKLTIMNLTITEFYCAIELEYSSDNQIISNTIAHNFRGVVIFSSSNNTISRNTIARNIQGVTITGAHNNIHGNNIADNSEYCIKLSWSFNNITENTLTNSSCGVSFLASTHNVFRNNTFAQVNQIFWVESSSFQDYIQDLDDSNTINGKPICIWVNKEDLTVPTNAGWVSLVNCTTIQIENLNFSYGQKISLISTTNSTISKNTFTNNQVCIFLEESANNTIQKNTFTNCEGGIQLKDSSNNFIIGNTMSSNNIGIDVKYSTNNSIQQNQITNNNQGLKMFDATENTISGNNFTANEKGIYLSCSTNIDSFDPYSSRFLCVCSDNTFLENNLLKNNFGIWMCSASNNTFSGNNFINNTNHLKMSDSMDITSFLIDQLLREALANSLFVNDTIIEQKVAQISKITNQTFIEFPSINFWSLNKTGNYWSNYNNTDNDSDGICDNPYVIDENNQDDYPLMVANVIPAFDYEQETSTSDMMFILIAVACVLPVIIVFLLHRWKKLHNKITR